MKRIVFVSIMIGLLFANLSEAADGWDLQIEPVWMGVYGNDIYVGDIWKYYQIFTEDEGGNWRMRYGMDYEPIITAMKSKLALRAELGYRKNQWGCNFSGWGFWTGGEVSGLVISPPMEYIPGGYAGYIYGVRMWNHTLVPVATQQDPSGFSPVDYWATNKLSVYTADILVTNTFIKKNEDDLVDLEFGLKIGRLNNVRIEGQKQWSYLKLSAPYWFIWDNHISLESRSRADYNLLKGPSLGTKIKKCIRDIKFDGFLRQSCLFGEARSSGLWLDVDDIFYRDFNNPEEIIYHDVYCGKFYFERNKKIALPVTEVKLNFSVDLSKKISLGAEIFSSIWWGAEMAPQWSVPGDWTCISGTGWQCRKETLIFSGTGLNLTFKF